MDKGIKNYINRFHFIIGILLLLWSLISVLAGNVRRYGVLKWDISTVIYILLFAFGLFLLEKAYSKIIDSNRTFLSRIHLFKWSKSGVLKGAVLFFVFYIVYFIIFFPGITQYDTTYAINDFFDGYSTFIYEEGGWVEITAFLNDHHPIFDTFIYAIFIKVGDIVGNAYVGIALYSLLQLLAASLIFSFMLCFMDKMGVKNGIKLFSFLILVLPFIGVYEVTMLKDVIYGNLFVLYYINYIYLVKIQEKKHNFIYLLILAMFLSLTKKTGVYLVLLSLLPLLLLLKNKFKVLICMMIPTIIMFVLLPKIIFPLFSIFPGGKQEVLGTFFQQTALMVVLEEDSISQEDKTVIDKVLKYDQLSSWYVADYTQLVKASMRWDAQSTDFIEYFKVWFKQGVRHPDVYVRATLGTCGGFFSPVNGQIEIYTDIAVSETDSSENTQDYGALTKLREWFISFYDQLANFKGNFLFYLFTYVWIIPGLILCKIVSDREWRSLICMFPVFISILLLVVCPLTKTRYAFSQILVIPLILALSGKKKRFFDI